MPQKTYVLWTARHCSRNDISRVVVLLQSRELRVPIEDVLEVLKQFAITKKKVGTAEMRRVRQH